MPPQHPAGRPPVSRAAGALLAGVLLLGGCAHVPTACDRSDVSAKVEHRTAFTVGPAPCGGLRLANGASLDDGLLEDEAALIALWNNASFQEQLADLGIAHGDLVQAGLLPNPEFVYWFPAPEKPYKYLFEFPLEALWLRPVRIKAAAGESARVCERLTQAALDLIRDVRQAYADVLLAKGRLRVAEEAVRIRGEILRLAEARLKAGDVSAQEVATARIDSLQAQQDAARAGYDVPLAEERLRNLLAIGEDRTPLQLDPAAPPTRPELDVEALAAEATASRPDALAAAQNAAAAAERLRLARLSWVRVLGIGDATSGRESHVFSPAVRFTVPIFNWNEGNIARAEAEWDRAERQRRTVHNQIVLDVRQAHLRHTQARAELEVLEDKVRPEAEAAIRRAEAAYREGDTPYVVVLQTTQQLLATLLRREVLHADLRRAWADLERSVGRRLLGPAHAEAAPAPAGVKGKSP
jgi:cobalt-zinc-cadmium efflux system outer membrane protein